MIPCPFLRLLVVDFDLLLLPLGKFLLPFCRFKVCNDIGENQLCKRFKNLGRNAGAAAVNVGIDHNGHFPFLNPSMEAAKDNIFAVIYYMQIFGESSGDNGVRSETSHAKGRYKDIHALPAASAEGRKNSFHSILYVYRAIFSPKSVLCRMYVGRAKYYF